MMVVKLVKWIIAWEKKADLVKDVKSIVGFNVELDGMTSHKHGLAAKYSFSFKMAASTSNFGHLSRRFASR